MVDFLEKIIKIINIIFWILMISFIVIWNASNREDFFPSPKVEEIKNPVNPFIKK